MKNQPDQSLISQASNLQRLWNNGGFAYTLQFPPLLTTDASARVEQVAAQVCKFDAVLTADAPDGAVALSSLSMAVLLKRAGIEVVVQISGRDRNRLALQSDLLGLDALDIHNLLIDMRPVTRASLGQNADARLVIDLNGPALLAAAVRLRDEGRFISGASIKKRPVFYTGAFFSLKENLESAALSSIQFFVTTPFNDVQSFITAFAAFQSSHPDVLKNRPLLVSLPLTTSSTEESLDVGVAGAQQIATFIKALRGFKEIRGFNIVFMGQSDLAALEQVIRMIEVHR